MTGCMGRPRKEGNKDLLPYLYVDRDGYYYVRHPATGVRAYLGTKDRAKAKELYRSATLSWEDEVLRAQAEKIANRIRGATNSTKSVTTSGYAATFRSRLPYIRKRNGNLLSAKTIADYSRMLTRVEKHEPFLAPLIDVGVDVCRQFLSPWRLSKPHYHNYMKALLARMFQAAVDDGLIRQSPMDDVNKTPTPTRDIYIKDAPYVAITEHMEEWEARACDLLYFVSHRPSDVLALTDANISYYEQRSTRWVQLTFTAAKNDQPMEIFDLADGVLEETLQWFRDWKRSQGIISPYFVVYPTTSRRRSIGKPVSTEYLSRRFAAAVVLAGYAKGAYQLRDVRKKGLNDEAILAGKPTEKGGHNTEQMKRHYVTSRLPKRVRNRLRGLRG